jgi:hypothetical protein
MGKRGQGQGWRAGTGSTGAARAATTAVSAVAAAAAAVTAGAAAGAEGAAAHCDDYESADDMPLALLYGGVVQSETV